MSLNAAERTQLAGEFASYLAASALSKEQLRERTGLSSQRFERAFAVAGGMDGVADIWLVRDKLETAAKEAGAPFHDFSKLSNANRAAARGWFGIEDHR